MVVYDILLLFLDSINRKIEMIDRIENDKQLRQAEKHLDDAYELELCAGCDINRIEEMIEKYKNRKRYRQRKGE